MFNDNLTNLVFVVLVMVILIIICVWQMKADLARKKNERDVRQMIIENKVDAETTKLLLEYQKKPEDKYYSTLRIGCLIVGGGLGAIIGYFTGIINKCNLFFWLIVAFGCGIGLLAAFYIEWKLKAKNKK